VISFSCYNIQYHKHPVEEWVVVSGDIRNDSPKSYHTAAFRLKLFAGQECIGASILKVQGFGSKCTRSFEVVIEGVHFNAVPNITRCDILFETVY